MNTKVEGARNDLECFFHVFQKKTGLVVDVDVLDRLMESDDLDEKLMLNRKILGMFDTYERKTGKRVSEEWLNGLRVYRLASHGVER